MKQWKTGPSLVKALAIFSVVGVHFILNTMDNVTISGTWPETVYFSYLQIFIICVPLFLLSTGYLNLHQEPSVKYYKKLLPILGTYVLYSLGALLFRHWWLGESFTGIEALHQILNFKAVPYAWYVKMFIGLFLLTPFLNKIIHSVGRRELDIFLGVLMLLTLLPLTFNFFTAGLLEEGGTLLPDFWTGLYPVTYYIAGARLRLYPLELKRWQVGIVGAVAAVLAVWVAITLSRSGQLTKINGEYGNLLTFLQSTAVFSLLIDRQVAWLNDSRLLRFISQNTLHIYLTSFISDQLVYGLLGPELLSGTYMDFRYALLFVSLSFTLAVAIVFLLRLPQRLLAWKPAPEAEKAS